MTTNNPCHGINNVAKVSIAQACASPSFTLREGNVVRQLITERIKRLRQEIAELTEKNRKYSLGPKYGPAVADHERRFQRLIEIIEDLKSLTDWKKP